MNWIVNILRFVIFIAIFIVLGLLFTALATIGTRGGIFKDENDGWVRELLTFLWKGIFTDKPTTLEEREDK